MLTLYVPDNYFIYQSPIGQLYHQESTTVSVLVEQEHTRAHSIQVSDEGGYLNRQVSPRTYTLE